jgi:L-lactate dehydrogenase complex protein LldG
MGDDRRRVMDRVRAAVAWRKQRAPLPAYADDIVRTRSVPGDSADSLVDRFCERLVVAGGRAFLDAAALAGWLEDQRLRHGYCDAGLLGRLGEAFRPFEIETRFARERIDEYGFGITQAAGAIAETGSLILVDRPRSRRLAAVAPWVHIAVVEQSRIHRDVADAIAALADEPYVVWCTGPSKTADVEGILIQGVHGPGEQVAWIV